MSMVDNAFRSDGGMGGWAVANTDRGRLLQSFVFEIGVGDRSAILLLRNGFVTEEFIDLAGKADRSDTEEGRLDELKADLARRLLAAPADEVYDVSDLA